MKTPSQVLESNGFAKGGYAFHADTGEQCDWDHERVCSLCMAAAVLVAYDVPARNTPLWDEDFVDSFKNATRYLKTLAEICDPTIGDANTSEEFIDLIAGYSDDPSVTKAMAITKMKEVEHILSPEVMPQNVN